jgi:hypothetical protein
VAETYKPGDKMPKTGEVQSKASPKRDPMEWPPTEAAVQEILDALAEPGGRADLSPLQAAVLGTLINSGVSLTVSEITEKLSCDYDRPPTPAAVLKVDASHKDRRTGRGTE